MEEASGTITPEAFKSRVEPSSVKISSPGISKNAIISVPESTEPPASIYQNITGKNLVMDYFEIPPIFQEEDGKDKANSITNHLLTEIRKRELGDTKESFNRIMKELEKTLNLTPDHPPYYKLNKIYEYVDIVSKELELRERKQLLTEKAHV